MRNIIMRLAFLALMATINIPAYPQGMVDVARAELIRNNRKRHNKQIERQTELLAPLGGAHTLMSTMTSQTSEQLKAFDEYLVKFRNTLGVAAEVYGIVYEINDAGKNIGDLNRVIAENIEGLFAVPFSTAKNRILQDMIAECINCANDISVAFRTGKRMTEMDRDKILETVRPKLHLFNRKLKKLTRAIQYTSFLTVWQEIGGRVLYRKPDRISIMKASLYNWKARAQECR